VHENERDLLENTVYRRLVSLWSEFSDAYAVFDKHGPAQLLCAQQVWEALLELSRQNLPSFQIHGRAHNRRRFSVRHSCYPQSFNNRALRAAYDQILDDLDDDKDITFAHIQTICARPFRRTKERHPDPPHRADTPRATPCTSPAKPEQYNKYKRRLLPSPSPSSWPPRNTSPAGSPATLTVGCR
jgi:hypothetical protein